MQNVAHGLGYAMNWSTVEKFIFSQLILTDERVIDTNLNLKSS